MIYIVIFMYSYYFVYVGCFVFLFLGLFYFGFLVIVLVSYFDVKYYKGIWLVCMEDIDELRCVKGVDVVIFIMFECYYL